MDGPECKESDHMMDSTDVTEEHRKRRSRSPVSYSEGSSSTVQEEGVIPENADASETDGGHALEDTSEPKPSIQEEIEQLARKKKEVVMKGKDTSTWKIELQKRLEQELERRVRDALETPPLERMRRNKHKAKLRKLQKEKEMEIEKQRTLSLSECQSYAQNLPSLKLKYPWNELRQFQYSDLTDPSWWNQGQKSNDLQDQNGSVASKYGSNKSEAILAKGLMTQSPTLQSLLDRVFEEGYGDNTDDDRDQLIADIKRKTFHRYTREGFKEALKKGKLKLKKIGKGRFMDKNGVVLTADGPFWPPECGPLYPKQEHITAVPDENELLSTHVPQESRTVENQKTKWYRPWEGTQVVYDSERMSKGMVPHITPEGCCQSLVFESRFESGNLRQARRIGQFEYDLVLKTDLYTNRHTQWFYFRIQHMVPGVTYKFNIVNLLKKDSLYNHGMRPLFYSESLARNKELGWHRAGHHINYIRNYNTSRNPLLHPEISYYSLEWQMEFPEECDICYLTHCYPYTFTDLCDHIDTLCADNQCKKILHREILCESRAGNSCFLLTVGSHKDEGKDSKNLPKRKGVIITARVHPGETNSSWMMKGLLDFITSSDPIAKDLRKAFTFKIIPMLNPDGVIVGNYRCSLAGRDLNRNFRHPKKDSFPTIYHTKSMLEGFGKDHDVIIYCDLHGHSRKHNVFIYGCDQQGKEMDAAAFLCQRLFPWLMSRQAPDKFSFNGCKFQVKRCKEATGRVVMWRQMGISNSFTMEATFCGSKNIQQSETPRHFNIQDFQDMGRHFCEALLDYHKAQENKSLHSEFIFELTKVITHQVLASRGLMPPNFNLFAKSLLSEEEEQAKDTQQNGIDGGGDSDMGPTETDQKQPQATQDGKKKVNKVKDDPVHQTNSKISKTNNSSKSHKASKKDKKQQLESRIRSKLEALRFIDSMSSETIQGCVNLIRELHVMTELAESDTSDSDSASESEIVDGGGEAEESTPSKQTKTKKRKLRGKKKGTSSGASENEGSKANRSTQKKSSILNNSASLVESKEQADNTDFAQQLRMALQALPDPLSQKVMVLKPKAYHLDPIRSFAVSNLLSQFQDNNLKYSLTPHSKRLGFRGKTYPSLPAIETQDGVQSYHIAGSTDITELGAEFNGYSINDETRDWKGKLDDENENPPSSAKHSLKKYPQFVNRYQNRSNNGIPMFAQERTQERALKRYQAIRRAEQERLERETTKFHLVPESDYARFLAFTQELEKRKAEKTHQYSAPPLSRTAHSHGESALHIAPRLEYISGVFFDMDSRTTAVPPTTPPRKLQPVPKPRNSRSIRKPSGDHYKVGFHVSKVGSDVSHSIESILSSHHEQANTKLVSLDPATVDKRRAMSSLGPIYLADLQGHPTLGGDNRIFFDENTEAEDFDLPPGYQELEKLRLMSVEPGTFSGAKLYDPFQEMDENDCDSAPIDANNNKRIMPSRAHTSFGFSSTSNFFMTPQQRQNTFHKLLGKDSNVIRRKTTATGVRKGPEASRHNNQHYQNRGEILRQVNNNKSPVLNKNNPLFSSSAELVKDLKRPVEGSGLQALVAKATGIQTNACKSDDLAGVDKLSLGVQEKMDAVT